MLVSYLPDFFRVQFSLFLGQILINFGHTLACHLLPEVATAVVTETQGSYKGRTG